jgi:hypothetical protein
MHSGPELGKNMTRIKKYVLLARILTLNAHSSLIDEYKYNNFSCENYFNACVV